MDNIKRPRFEDIKGHNDEDDGIYADALEEYVTKLERYADRLERCNKGLKNRNKWLLTTLDHHSIAYSAACNAVRFAVGDAISDVSEWRRFAVERGMEESFDHNVNSEKSYIEGVAQFYINLGYRNERLQKEARFKKTTEGGEK